MIYRVVKNADMVPVYTTRKSYRYKNLMANQTTAIITTQPSRNLDVIYNFVYVCACMCMCVCGHPLHRIWINRIRLPILLVVS